MCGSSVIRGEPAEDTLCRYQGAYAMCSMSAAYVQHKKWLAWLLGQLGCHGCGPSGLVGLVPTARGIVNGWRNDGGRLMKWVILRK